MHRGAANDSTDIDRFIGACLRADRPSAEQLLAEHPGLLDRMTDDDRGALVEAAGSASVAAVGLMLDLGFTPDARNGFGEQPLHSAAYSGNADMVRLLIEAGADVDGRDLRFDATPLAFATVGSGERAEPPGNWIEVVRLLVDAGASRDGVWISGKPPSEEVADLLAGYGITPDDEPESRSRRRGPPVTLARYRRDGRCRPAPGSRLPRPRPRAAGVAPAPSGPLDWSLQQQRQVLDWYRSLLADGIRSHVESVEVDGDAVVLGLSVARQAEGARPAPPELLYQVFTVEDAQVFEIHVYPDRATHSPVPPVIAQRATAADL